VEKIPIKTLFQVFKKQNWHLGALPKKPSTLKAM
jgi:hypothetical protein